MYPTTVLADSLATQRSPLASKASPLGESRPLLNSATVASLLASRGASTPCELDVRLPSYPGAQSRDDPAMACGVGYGP